MQVSAASKDQVATLRSASTQLKVGTVEAAQASLRFSRNTIAAATAGAIAVARIGGDASGLLAMARTAFASVDQSVKTIADGIASAAADSGSQSARMAAQRELSRLGLQVRGIKADADTVAQIASYRTSNVFDRRQNRIDRSDIDATYASIGGSINAARFKLTSPRTTTGLLGINLSA